MKKVIIHILSTIGLMLLLRCHSPVTEEADTGIEVNVQTPVTVTTVAIDTITDYIEVNATSAFLQSNIVKASANGYLTSVYVKPGMYVEKGKSIFIIQTKESKNIGTIINKLDTSFQFSGITTIKASESGYIRELNHQAGDYVQDGEQLAAINTANSFGFIMNLPYEEHNLLQNNHDVEITLADGSKFMGEIGAVMPTMDSVSQTQQILIRINSDKSIPQNLIGKVKLIRAAKSHAVSLPRSSILSDESQTNFWVMKMIDSVTAVKVPVTIGMATADKIEILTPALSQQDTIVLTGNYGLGDTAKVKIVQPQE